MAQWWQLTQAFCSRDPYGRETHPKDLAWETPSLLEWLTRWHPTLVPMVTLTISSGREMPHLSPELLLASGRWMGSWEEHSPSMTSVLSDLE